jgi:hypothetical protein
LIKELLDTFQETEDDFLAYSEIVIGNEEEVD